MVASPIARPVASRIHNSSACWAALWRRNQLRHGRERWTTTMCSPSSAKTYSGSFKGLNSGSCISLTPPPLLHSPLSPPDNVLPFKRKDLQR